MADIKLDLSAKLPGEGLLIAIITAITQISTTNREKMSQPNIDRYDAVGATILEDAAKIGRKFWLQIGALDA
jgi:hypothetical protein